MARLDILKHFEMLKRKFDPSASNNRSRLQLSYLGEELSAAKLGDFVKTYNAAQEEAVKETGAVPIKLTQRGSSQVDLPSNLMASLFQPLFDNITSKVGSLVEQAKAKNSPVNFIFMVGGFSESPFLKSEIKNKFSGEGDSAITVLVPRRP